MRRRDFMCGALAGAVFAPPAALAESGADDALRGLLEVVQLAVFASEHMLHRGILESTAATLVERIHTRERAHVERLSAMVAPPRPSAPADLAEADRRLERVNASARLSRVHDEGGALRLLYDLESLAIGRCYAALQTVESPTLVRTTAEIMGAEAQHASALGGLLHPGKWSRVVPVGSVQGRH